MSVRVRYKGAARVRFKEWGQHPHRRWGFTLRIVGELNNYTKDDAWVLLGVLVYIKVGGVARRTALPQAVGIEEFNVHVVFACEPVADLVLQGSESRNFQPDVTQHRVADEQGVLLLRCLVVGIERLAVGGITEGISTPRERHLRTVGAEGS